MNDDSIRDMFDNRVIRASAGTGKTFELSNRFLKLLASGVPCETILATTFTRMGAGEILDRIVQRLSLAALKSDAAEELADQLQWPSLTQQRAQELLRTLINGLHRLQIGTLDAFFHRIAQSFSLELDLPDDWQIVDEQQIGIMHDRVIQEVLREQTVINLLHLLNKGEAQRRVADLIRATVGKLYVTYLESDRPAWHRLPECKTFLNEQELHQIFQMLSDIDYGHKTINKTAQADLDLFEAGNWLNFTTDAKLFGRIAQGNLKYYKKTLPDDAIVAYRQLIPHCRAHVIELLIRKNTSTFGLLDEFGTRLEVDKNETGELRFDDITRRLETFIADSQTDGFSFRLDHTIDHLLLDEFQDTSIAQWRVLKPFAARTTESDSSRSFFCVGDVKQAIYSWRGGVSAIFDLVDDELQNVTGQSLNKSWRSSPVVIESVNQVFGNLQNFKCDKEVVTEEVRRWGQQYQTQTTARDYPGYFSLEYADDADEETKKNNRHAVTRSRNANVLAQTTAKVRQLHEEMPDKTIGVLVRKNQTISQLIFMLQQDGIPASEEGGNAITDAASVEYILSAMTLADHPSDRVARFHLSHSPLAEEFGLQPEDPQNKSANVLPAYNIAEKIRADVSRAGIGPTVESMARTLSPACTPRELTRLQQLVQEAYNYEAATDDINTKLRLSRFVNHIRDVFRAREPSSANIRVMTIHQSKGLEFDIVVLPMIFNTGGWATHQPDVVVGRPRATDPIDLACRHTNETFRAMLPPEFQTAFEDHQRQLARDNLCLLYVGLTRAVYATHAIMSYSVKPKAMASDSLLLMSLLPKFTSKDRRPGIVYQAGDDQWHKKLEAESYLEADDSLAGYYLPNDALLVDAALAEENRSGRGVQSASPSQLEGGDTINLSSVFGRIDNREAMTRGTMIHGCFEIIRWLDAGLPTRDELAKHLYRLKPEIQDNVRFVDEFEQMIKIDGVQKILTRQSYQQDFMPGLIPPDQTIMDALALEVFNERPFAVNLDSGFMQGTIDRLVVAKEGNTIVAADIIDYKTDSVTPDSLDERVEHYRPQLEAYRSAVSRFLNLEPSRIATRLLFVGTGDLVTIEQGCPAESGAGPQASNSENDNESEIQDSKMEVPQPKFQSQEKSQQRSQQLKFWQD